MTSTTANSLDARYQEWAAKNHTMNAEHARAIVARIGEYLSGERVTANNMLSARQFCERLNGCPGSVRRALASDGIFTDCQDLRRGVLGFVSAQIQRQLVCNGLRVVA